MKIKVTEYSICPTNKPENQIINKGVAEGDFNLLMPFLTNTLKSLDKQKSSYFYTIQIEDKEEEYRFSLNTDKFALIKKKFPKAIKR